MKNENSCPGGHTFDRETAKNLHLDYIARRWKIIAAVVWKEYLAGGRGAVLFTPSTDFGGEWDYIYLPLETLEGHPLMKEYANMLRSYDPTRQVVALFLTPPDCVSGYCGGLTPECLSPPEAYKRFKGVFNWN
jgi:hypothetical protein